MPPMTGEFPRVIPRPAWLTARARNAVNRPVFIGSVAAGTFIATLVALILAPQQVRREATPLPLPPSGRPDTAPLTAALSHARVRLAAAESSLAFARAHAVVAASPVVDTLGPRIVARRDSLAAGINDLDALITRVETAPVSASYRALAESPQLTSVSRVRILLDSLTDVERERDAFGPAGSSDPGYVARNSRISQIGRGIQQVAQERREALRQQIAKLGAPVSRETVASQPTA